MSLLQAGPSESECQTDVLACFTLKFSCKSDGSLATSPSLLPFLQLDRLHHISAGVAKLSTAILMCFCPSLLPLFPCLPAVKRVLQCPFRSWPPAQSPGPWFSLTLFTLDLSARTPMLRTVMQTQPFPEDRGRSPRCPSGFQAFPATSCAPLSSWLTVSTPYCAVQSQKLPQVLCGMRQPRLLWV